MTWENGVSPERETLHRISAERINRFGGDYFMRLTVERIEQSAWQTAGIAGVRIPEDVSYLKDKFGFDFILFHIFVSDPRIWYERTRKRAEARYPQTYDEFLEQDRAEQSLFKISQAIKRAD